MVNTLLLSSLSLYLSSLSTVYSWSCHSTRHLLTQLPLTSWGFFARDASFKYSSSVIWLPPPGGKECSLKDCSAFVCLVIFVKIVPLSFMVPSLFLSLSPPTSSIHLLHQTNEQNKSTRVGVGILLSTQVNLSARFLDRFFRRCKKCQTNFALSRSYVKRASVFHSNMHLILQMSIVLPGLRCQLHID